MSRCRVYRAEDGRIYVKHAIERAYAVPIAPWNRHQHLTLSPDHFSPGDVILKHHYPGTTAVRIRSLDGTIEQLWYIE